MRHKHMARKATFPLFVVDMAIALIVAFVLFLLFLRYVWLIDLNLPQIVWER